MPNTNTDMKGLYKKSHHLGSRVDRASATIQAVSLDGACWAAAVLGCWPTTLLCITLPCISKVYEYGKELPINIAIIANAVQ